MSKTDFLILISLPSLPFLFNKFGKHLVSICYVPSTVVGAVNKIDKNSCPYSADILMEGEGRWRGREDQSQFIRRKSNRERS